MIPVLVLEGIVTDSTRPNALKYQKRAGHDRMLDEHMLLQGRYMTPA